MTKDKAIELVRNTDKELTTLMHIASTLHWDLETQAPKLAVEARSDQLGYLTGIAYKKKTSPKLLEALNILKDNEIDDKVTLKIVNNLYRDYERNSVLPESIVREFSEITAKASSIWSEARSKNDYTIYAPTLKKIIELSQEQSKIWANGGNQYDALIDDYERGMKSSDIDSVFNPLRDYVVKFLDRRVDKEIDDSFLYEKYDIEKQKQFGLDVLKDMGFNFDKGLELESVHPFTTTLGYDDVRITTRFDEEDVVSPLFSTIHEGGHAMYEQNASSGRLYKTSLAQGATLGFHESQSRLYENLIGRSKDFWIHYYPKFVDTFPNQLKNVDLDTFLVALNKVQPGKIRVNADEVTYNLHIMLRYEIEKEIINSDINVNEIPGRWNDLMSSYLGIKIEKDSEGVLQDIHWSGGSFGYFPTYALGNLYGAMILDQINSENSSLSKDIQNGNLITLKETLNDKVWKHGALYEPSVLLNNICGDKLSEKPFINYLENKYKSLGIIK